MMRSSTGFPAIPEIPEPNTLVLLGLVALHPVCVLRRRLNAADCRAGCLAVVILAFLAGGADAPAASLEGHTLQSTTWSVWPHGTTPLFAQTEFVVGPTVEVSDFHGYLDIDASDTNILITASADREKSYDPQYLTFKDIYGTIPRFVAVTVNPATTWDDFDPVRVHFYPNYFGVWLYMLPATKGQQISLDIVTMVPEPAGWPLAVLATAGLPLVARVMRRGERRRFKH